MLLRAVPFFGVLPAYEIERLAQRGRWNQVDAGTVVVRQGEPGEWFFLIGDGEFGVDVDGVALAKVLKRDRPSGRSH